MRRPHRPTDHIERKPTRLGRELHLTPHMEEGEIPSHQVMRDPRRFVEDVDLPVEDVLGLFEVVLRGASGSGLDLVEAGGEVGGRVGGLRADAGVKVNTPCLQLNGGSRVSNVWKSATVALRSFGKGTNSWPAPLMMVRGTSLSDTGCCVSRTLRCGAVHSLLTTA